MSLTHTLILMAVIAVFALRRAVRVPKNKNLENGELMFPEEK